MELWHVILIVASLLATTAAFVYLIFKLQRIEFSRTANSYTDQAEEDVAHLFNEEFREELRNRGKLRFEKIISENALFLEQDLRLTTSQLNEYLKGEITKKLHEEFSKYQKSIDDIRNLASESITKTQKAIEQEREAMSQQLQQEIAAEKQRMIKHFEDNMTNIVNHYVISAVGDQIDLSNQLEYILAQLEENKKTIMEDISNGA